LKEKNRDKKVDVMPVTAKAIHDAKESVLKIKGHFKEKLWDTFHKYRHLIISFCIVIFTVPCLVGYIVYKVSRGVNFDEGINERKRLKRRYKEMIIKDKIDREAKLKEHKDKEDKIKLD
jgi:hypothetical protein